MYKIFKKYLPIVLTSLSLITTIPLTISCSSSKLSYVNFEKASNDFQGFEDVGITKWQGEIIYDNSNVMTYPTNSDYWHNSTFTSNTTSDINDPAKKNERFTFSSFVNHNSTTDSVINPFINQTLTGMVNFGLGSNNTYDNNPTINKYDDTSFATINNILKDGVDIEQYFTNNNFKFFHPTNERDYVSYFKQLTDTYSSLTNQPYNIVVSSQDGYNAINNFYKAYPERFNKLSYTLVDSNFGDYTFYNDDRWKQVSSVVFATEQAAFLGGIAACQYLNENYDLYKRNKNDKLVVGTYGAMNIDPVNSYIGGFQKGVEFFNTIVEGYWEEYRDFMIANDYFEQDEDDNFVNHKIKFLSWGKDIKNWYVGNFNPTGGKQKIKKLLDSGADVILPVAGEQYTNAIDIIYKRKSPAVVVGVDSAIENFSQNKKWNIHNYYDHNKNNDIVKFSITKNATQLLSRVLDITYTNNNVATYYNDVTDDYEYISNINGHTDDLAYGGPGFVTAGTISNNGVKPSIKSYSYLANFISAYNDDYTIDSFKDDNGLIDYDLIRYYFENVGFTWSGHSEEGHLLYISDLSTYEYRFFYL